MTVLHVSTARPLRCAACQLQLCKSRDEPPHKALKEVTPPGIGGAETTYSCQTCGATLVRTFVLSRPGWQHRAAAQNVPR